MEVGGMENKEEPKMEVPWIPTTPFKPNLQKQVPIYSSGEGNHANGAVACHELKTAADKISKAHDGSLVPETTVTNIISDSGKSCVKTAYDSVPQGYGHFTFQQLLCQAEKGSLECSNANTLFSSFMSQFNGDPVPEMANGANSHHKLSLETKIVQDSARDTQGTAHDAFWSNRTSQDSPFMIDSAVRSERRQVAPMQINTEENNPGGEEKKVSAEKLDNNGTTLHKELHDPVVEYGAVSIPPKENHPDTGSNLVIDLNKTPQQKPRKRKHRPKVITEGKPRRPRKPAAQKSVESKENPTGKRKYVRKKGATSNSTTSAEEIAELIKDRVSKSAKRSCRRSLNFDIGKADENSTVKENAAHLGKDGVIVQETNAGLAHNQTTSMQHASNNMSLPEDTRAPNTSPSGAKPQKTTTAKRKYTRRKKMDNSSAPPAEVTGSSLNCDIGAMDENPVGSKNATVHLSKEIRVATQEKNERLPSGLSTSMEQPSNMPLPEEAQGTSKGSFHEAQPKEKPIGYERRKKANKLSTTPAEIKGLNEPLMDELYKMSIRSLNLRNRARDESPICEENQSMCFSKENMIVAEEMHANVTYDQSTPYISLPAEVQVSTTSAPKGISPGTEPKGRTTRKRTSVRRKGLKTSTLTAEMKGELTEASMPEYTDMSCTRSLNFDIGARNQSSMCCRENLNVHLSKENGAVVKETHMNLPCVNHALYNMLLHAETKKSSKIICPKGKLNVDANSEENRNKRNVQTAAWDGYENSASILLKKMAQSNPSSSVSQMVGFERKHSVLPVHQDTYDMNLTGAQYNGLATYQKNSWVLFPNIHDLRHEMGRSSSFFEASSMTTTREVQPTFLPKHVGWNLNASNSNCWGSKTENYADFVNFVSILRDMQGSCSSPALISDCASLTRTRNYHTEPIFSAKQGISDGHTFKAAERPLTCIDAPVAETLTTHPKKKRTTKKKALSGSTDSRTNEMQQLHNFGEGSGFNQIVVQETVHSVDVSAEQFRQLNMNTEARYLALQEQNALVPYNQQNIMADGTIIPFHGPFDPIKKHPRPKVDLDDETDRVWKLLKIDINSHGIDGTNEEKAKWWEEERNVFRGRADSFIARMHLVQGDRRFSRWKGSVLDSVVGVFLTQNVSDHLSSSAFMSLAARYPKKSSSTCKKYNGEGTSLVDKEPQVHIVEPEENTEWDVKTLNQPIYDQSLMTVDMVEHSGEREAVNSNYSSRIASSMTSLTDEPNWILSESSQMKTKTCYEDMRTELNDPVSSQSSVISSQISGDLSNDQIPEKIGSCSDSTSEVEDLSSTEKDSSIYNSFSHEYSYKLTAVSGELEANCFDPFKTEASSSGFMKNKNENDKNRPYCQRTESASQVVISHSQSMGAQGAQDLLQIARDLGDHKDAERKEIKKASSAQENLKKIGEGKVKQEDFNWDSLRIKAQAKAGKREKTENTLDSLDWDAVRRADVSEISDIIKERGMNNRLAERIKDFLNRLVEEHGDIDLEWLRDVPPDQAKEYLLSVKGLGLKSVECVRLLTLHHLAFPVDTNVGRIAVRLGWVPLQPLPESLQLHLLELYPVLESIQKYLWPRLCKLDQKTLYELHYQMITFGKVFCTKSKPNCNACPMRGECRHFASAFASARLALPGPEQRSIVSTSGNNVTEQNPTVIISQLHLPAPENANQGAEIRQTEVGRQMELISEINKCQPIIEEPTTPEPECSQVSEIDMEDAFIENSCEIPTIKLDMDEFTQTLQNYMQENMELQEGEMSKALVALNPEAASIPMPKLKNVSRLRTEHCVYELPDRHPLLEGWDRREPDDPGKYLLAIWTPGETANSIQPPEAKCSSKECGQLCDEKECLSCNSYREASSQIVRGTVLIPCRTAMWGSFPLNGTYFQVNEVFADHESSLNPISVPRSWIWNLNRRTVYFGTSIPSIFKGLSTQEIQQCFWRGYVCVRGVDRATRAPRPLMARLHFPVSKLPRARGNIRERPTAAQSRGPEPNPEQQSELLTAAKSQGPEPNAEQLPELLIAVKPHEPELNLGHPAQAPHFLMAKQHFPASKLPRTKGNRKRSTATKPKGQKQNQKQQSELLTAAKSQGPEPDADRLPELVIAAKPQEPEPNPGHQAQAPHPLMVEQHFQANKLPRTKGIRKRRSAAKSKGPEPNPEQQPELLIVAKPQPEPNPEHPELFSNGHNFQ